MNTIGHPICRQSWYNAEPIDGYTKSEGAPPTMSMVVYDAVGGTKRPFQTLEEGKVKMSVELLHIQIVTWGMPAVMSPGTLSTATSSTPGMK